MEKYIKYCKVPKDMELIFMEQATSDDEVLAKAKDADFIFADAIKEVSKKLISNMPNLKLIHSEGVAFNKIDIETAKKLNVYVCNNRGANAGAVAEQTILLMLGLLRNVLDGDRKVRIGKQIETKERMMLEGVVELADCTVGLIGFGAIAKETAKRLNSFGCKLYYYSRRKASDEIEKEYNVEYKNLDELASECDIISLHVPVTAETTNMIDEKFLAKMKKTAFLINTARGEIVDGEALKNALIKGELGGAGLDTLSPEPVKLDNPLLDIKEELKYKILFSPHIGGTTEGAFRRMHQGVWENISRVSAGEKPINVVNGV
ncbi:2-hydroxyacid dehydrogenase [Clostridium hydrogenum]|uniref:2-hydroxyacid dehydrogenase n=1 Tax=Clostridium hydrogenum TaxID=2855764 RepID=UPI002E360CB4|nr:NAD(P)-dependent oxidoreductase [Clostridium hydrogenum]